jgi:hypothetical protein
MPAREYRSLGLATVAGATVSVRRALTLALAVYVLWVVATYLLEGRIHTLLRPEARFDRFIYTVVANVVVGIAVASMLIRRLVAARFIELRQAGFSSLPRSLAAVAVGAGTGLLILLLQSPDSMDVVILSNAFSQVLPVTIAEMIVCWALLGCVVESGLRGRGAAVAVIAAAAVSSAVFGVYHFGHSPPFNSVSMVLFLSAVGAVTSLFFFISRSVYGTIVFHNFLGMSGVLSSLAASGKIASYSDPLYPLHGLAVLTVLLLFGAHRMMAIRQAGQ